MKYLVIAVLFLTCIFVGFIISQKYRKRANFFKALVLVCQKLNVEISYSREKLKNLLSNFDSQTKSSLCGITENYLGFIDKEAPLDKSTLFKGIIFLKEDEKDAILLFFKTLGRSDVESQSKELKNFEKRFEEYVSSTTLDNKKYGSMSIKLGVMAGLAVAIILF